MVIVMYEDYIGKQVKKKSGKPFKSKLLINTIKGIIEHPILKEKEDKQELAFTFNEDDSYVSVFMCEIVANVVNNNG